MATKAFWLLGDPLSGPSGEIIRSSAADCKCHPIPNILYDATSSEHALVISQREGTQAVTRIAPHEQFPWLQ